MVSQLESQLNRNIFFRFSRFLTQKNTLENEKFDGFLITLRDINKTKVVFLLVKSILLF